MAATGGGAGKLDDYLNEDLIRTMHDNLFAGLNEKETNQKKKSMYGGIDVGAWRYKPWGPLAPLEMLRGPFGKGTYCYFHGPTQSGKSWGMAQIAVDQDVRTRQPPPGFSKHPLRPDIVMGMSKATTSRKWLKSIMPKACVHGEYREDKLLRLIEYLNKQMDRKTMERIDELIRSGVDEEDIDEDDVGKEVLRNLRYPFVIMDDVTGGDPSTLKTKAIRQICKLGRHVNMTMLVADQAASYLPKEMRSNITMVICSSCPDDEAETIHKYWGKSIFPKFAEFKYWLRHYTKNFMKLVMFPQDTSGILTNQIKLFRANPPLVDDEHNPGTMIPRWPKIQLGGDFQYVCDMVQRLGARQLRDRYAREDPFAGGGGEGRPQLGAPTAAEKVRRQKQLDKLRTQEAAQRASDEKDAARRSSADDDTADLERFVPQGFKVTSKGEDPERMIVTTSG